MDILNFPFQFMYFAHRCTKMKYITAVREYKEKTGVFLPFVCLTD